MSEGGPSALWPAPMRGGRWPSGPASLAALQHRMLPAGELSADSAGLVGALTGHATTVGAGWRAEVLHLLAAVAAAVRVSAVDTPVADGCRTALDSCLPVLLPLLDDGEPAVRTAAAGVLGEMVWCAALTVPVLRARFTAERAREVRLSLVLAVGKLLEAAPAGGPDPERRRAQRWLQRQRTGADPALRLAGMVLARRRPQQRARALPALLAGLAEADPAPVPGTRLCDLLTRELDTDREARVAVATRLFAVRGGAGPDALRATAGVVSSWRSAAADLLPLVADRLTDADPAVRSAAAHLVAVAGADDPAAYADRLAPLLVDPAARVADLAAWGLARMGDDRCLPRLRNRALIGTSVFDVVQSYYPRHVYLFTAPALFDVLAPLSAWAGALLPRIGSALSDADSYHQRRVLLAVLARWGAAAAPAVGDLVPLLDSDAAVHACAALGAAGPAAETAGHRLFRLVERGGTARLRMTAGWAHWRVSGDPDTALRALGDALDGESATVALPLVADLGPVAAPLAGRVRALGSTAGSGWVRTVAAYAGWRLTGDGDTATEELLPVLAPLAAGRVGPVTARAVAAAAALRAAGPADPRLTALLEPVARADRRYSYYGDWRAVADDQELARYASAYSAYPAYSAARTSTTNLSGPAGWPPDGLSP